MTQLGKSNSSLRDDIRDHVAQILFLVGILRDRCYAQCHTQIDSLLDLANSIIEVLDNWPEVD